MKKAVIQYLKTGWNILLCNDSSMTYYRTNPYDLLSVSESETGDNVVESDSELTSRIKQTVKIKCEPIKVIVINCNSILNTEKCTQYY